MGWGCYMVLKDSLSKYGGYHHEPRSEWTLRGVQSPAILGEAKRKRGGKGGQTRISRKEGRKCAGEREGGTGGIGREGGLGTGAAWQLEAEAAGNWPHWELDLADHSLE